MTSEQPGPDDRRRSSLVARLLWLSALVEDGILIALLVGMIGVAATQIVLRNLFHAGLLWADPALRVMVLWVGLLGAVVATREDRQITVDVLSRYLAPRWKAATRVLTDLFAATVSGLMGANGVRFVLEERGGGMTAFGSVPVWVAELILPAAFSVIALRYVGLAVLHLRQALARKAAR